MNKFLNLCLWILLSTTLSGCGGMLTSDEPAEHVYWLEATDLRLGEPSAGPEPDLLVAVSTLPGLDTDRILVKGPGARLNHYAGARWPDHLPEVITATIRLSLESSGRFSRVSTRPQSSGDEWLLELELREFFAVASTTDGAPEVHVQLAGNLDCNANSTTVNASATASANANRLSTIVAAFQSATNQAMTSLGGELEAACFR